MTCHIHLLHVWLARQTPAPGSDRVSKADMGSAGSISPCDSGLAGLFAGTGAVVYCTRRLCIKKRPTGAAVGTDDMTRLEELRTSMVEAHKALVSALDGFSRAELDRPSSNEGWSAKDTLAHLATIEDRQRQQVRAALDGTPWTPTDDINTYNERKVAERRNWPLDQVLEELEHEHHATLSLLDQIEEADLDRPFNHPRRGPMTIHQMFGHMPEHTQMHTAEVLAAARGH